MVTIVGKLASPTPVGEEDGCSSQAEQHIGQQKLLLVARVEVCIVSATCQQSHPVIILLHFIVLGGHTGQVIQHYFLPSPYTKYDNAPKSSLLPVGALQCADSCHMSHESYAL